MSGSLQIEKPPTPPVGPTQDRWDSLAAAEQEQLGEALLQQQQDYEDATFPPESNRHAEARAELYHSLRGFFGDSGREVYIAAACAVFYPGEPGFTPDLIVAMDAPTHPRDSWMVAVEHRGLDVVIEVRYQGSWKKDYVANVRRYARLGISEYFLFDLGSLSLSAFRLPPGGGEYEQVPVRTGRVRSERLGLELGVRRGRLRFFVHGALVPTAEECLADLAEQEQARADQEQARADSSLAGLRRVLFALLAQKAVVLPEAQAALVQDCADPELLTRWCQRALAGGEAEAIFGDG